MKSQVFKYNQTGKKILIIAGVHGDQHTSIYAAQLFAQNLQDKTITVNSDIGVIEIVNFVNYIGMFNFTRQNQNGVDLNREFNKSKSSEKVVQKLKKLIAKYDIVIDLHSSFNTTQFCYLNKDKWCQSFISFLSQLQLRYVINGDRTSTVKTYTNQIKDKIGFTIQLNQKQSDIDINSAYHGLQYLIKILSNIKKLKKQSNTFSNILQSRDISADISGLMTLKCMTGKYYKRGQLLGYINGLDSQKNISILMPQDGVVIAFPIKMAYIKVGQPLLKYQTY